MIDSFHFIRPLWLLVLPAAGLLVVLLSRLGDPREAWRGVIEPHLLEVLLSRRESQRSVQPAHLLGIGWLLAIVALAGPAWRREPSPFAEDTAALVLVVEVTESMLSNDVQPSRLERATQKIGDLLALRPDTDVALVAYAASAHRVMPLTRDATVIEYFARALSPEIMPGQGDAAAAAIELANAELRRAGRSGSITLFSDGLATDQLDVILGASSVPVNVLALGAPPPGLTSLERIAGATGGTVVHVGPDEGDVVRLAREAERRIARAAGGDGTNWKDEGYWLLPLLALIVLFWSRKGWTIEIPGAKS